MLVLNTCTNDARVLRSARSLAERGAVVRVFALGNRHHPEGVVMVDGVEVQRLEVRSWLLRILGVLRLVYLVVRGTPAGSTGGGGSTAYPRWLRYALVPFLPLLLLIRTVTRPRRPSGTLALFGRVVSVRWAMRRCWARHQADVRRRRSIRRWRTRRWARTRGRRVSRALQEVLPAAFAGPTSPPGLRRRHRAGTRRFGLDLLVYRWRRRRHLTRLRWQARTGRLQAWWTALLAPRRARRDRARLDRVARHAAALRRHRIGRLQAARRGRRNAVLRAAARARRHRQLRRSAFLARTAVVRRARRILRSGYLRVHHGLRWALLPVHRPSMILAFWKSASAAMLDWEPDVIHAHDLNTMPAARRTADALDVPVVYDSHELWRHRNRHGQLRPLGRLADAVMERRLAPRADAVITVSPSIARWLEDRYRLRGPVHVVRNTPTSERREPMRGIIERRPGERVVVYSGRFTSGRGLEDMVRALSVLPPHVVLAGLGYGDAEYVEALTRLARRLGVSRRFRLYEPVAAEDVPAVLATADLALVAIEPTCLSYRYALPNKLFEAIHAGIPVVATDLPDIAEIVTDYELGRQFVPGRWRDLAAAVAEILENPAAARSTSRRAAQELCWEVEVERLMAVYDDLGFHLTDTSAGSADWQGDWDDEEARRLFEVPHPRDEDEDGWLLELIGGSTRAHG